MTDGQITSHRVAIASGMVAVQANCTPDEAVMLMQARADQYPADTLESIAKAVIDRSIRIDPQP